MENNTKSPSPILNGTYYVVQSFMVNKLQLKGLEKEIYAIIFGFCQNANQYFSASLGLLQSWTCSTRPSVINALKKLVDKGFLYKETYNVPLSKNVLIRYYALAYEDRTYSPDEILGELVK